MQQSDGVRDGLLRFYQRFSSGDPVGFAEGIAQADGVSVIGTGPGEGHHDRESWISTYETMMRGEMAGTRLEAGDPGTYEEGAVGWGVDDPHFVFPDGSRLPTRLTAVLHSEDGDWKVLHLHFSVGIPDEQAMELVPRNRPETATAPGKCAGRRLSPEGGVSVPARLINARDAALLVHANRNRDAAVASRFATPSDVLERTAESALGFIGDHSLPRAGRYRLRCVWPSPRLCLETTGARPLRQRARSATTRPLCGQGDAGRPRAGVITLRASRHSSTVGKTLAG
jgi:hypothetical protein